MTTTPAQPTDAAPGSTQVANAMKQVVSSSTVVQIAMQTLLNQPDIVLTELPFLPGHQQTARQHANNWFKDVNPSLIQVIGDIVDFGGNWQAYSDPLFALATKFLTDSTAKPQFNQGLQDLLTLVTQKQATVAATITQIDTFRQALEDDNRNFTADQQTAENKITGDNGTLTRLNEDLKTFQHNRDVAIGEISGGTVMELVGGLMMVVGAVAEVVTFGTATVLVLGGLAVAGGGVALTVVGVKTLHQAENDMTNTMDQITVINQDLTALTHVSGQIRLLNSAVVSALAAVRDMEKAWQTLSTDLTELTQDVTDTAQANWVTVKLQATGKAWAKMLTDATTLQTYGKLNVEVSTDLSKRQN